MLSGCTSTGFVVQSDIPGVAVAVAVAVANARQSLKPNCRGDNQVIKVDASAKAELTRIGQVRQTVRINNSCSSTP